MRLKDKIAELTKANNQRLESEISELERMINPKKGDTYSIMFLKHGSKRREELMEIKRQKEAELNDTYEIDNKGWEYLEDVCYLSDEEMREFESTYKYNLEWCNRQSLLNAVNYLKYLDQDITDMESRYERYKRCNRKPLPAKELITVLEYIGSDHEVADTLIGLLASFRGDYSGDLVSYDQRVAYQLKRDTAAKLDQPKSNLIVLSERKKEYKAKKKDLYSLTRSHKPKKYRSDTDTLLLNLQLIR